ncbi:type II secretion system protein N [Marinicella sp. W31]|uniref:type II secretion system protein N n=1 Tax=Marinicella sp. W31 TaxID=3023713 RepID=UPI0037563377
MNSLKNNLIRVAWWCLLLLLFWLWLDFFLSSDDGNEPQSGIQLTQQQSATQNLTPPKISTYHLLGAAVQSAPIAALGSSSETRLNLSVTGLLASTDPNLGTAYISNNQGEEEKFAVGDTVFGMASLSAVYTDHVLLLHNSKQEKLSLQKDKIQTTSQNQRTPKDNSSALSRINSSIRGGDKNWEQLLDTQNFDTNKIANIVGNISPVQDADGRINGLRVSSLSASNTLLKQGLRSYDQIVAINGIGVNPGNILNITNQLENSSSAQLTILRNGREVQLNVNLNELKK